MIKKSFIFLLSFLVAAIAHAQSEVSFPLWPNGAPGALGTASNDIPTLTVFLPDTTNITAAMVICPGGAYVGLADHEGKNYALWLNSHGIAAFALKYRLGPKYHHPVELGDVTRALRTVRARAGEWDVDPNRIGIMGSSAGGHLASTLLTHFDAGDANSSDPVERVSSRPDLGILCYPVITLTEPFTHRGSRNSLLGANPSPDLVKELSNELQVKSNTPPCFVWTTFEDRTVPVENSMMFAEALRKAKVPFDLHVYQKGGHGMGLGTRDMDESKFHPWTADCIYWLKQQGFAK